MKAKVKHLSILIIDLILYSVVIDSVLIASLHHYPDINPCYHCSIGKFAADLSSGDKEAFYPIIIPYFVCLFLISESLIFLFRVLTVSVGTRSPPLYIPLFTV